MVPVGYVGGVDDGVGGLGLFSDTPIVHWLKLVVWIVLYRTIITHTIIKSSCRAAISHGLTNSIEELSTSILGIYGSFVITTSQ